MLLPLQNGKYEYDLATDIAAVNRPDEGIQYPRSATLIDSSSYRQPVEIIGQNEWDNLDRHDLTGRVRYCHINRTTNTLRIDAAPNDTGDVTYTIELTVLAFPPAAKTCTPGDPIYPVVEAWQEWAIVALAARLADGPVRRLPRGELSDLRNREIRLMDDLKCHANRDDHGRHPKVTHMGDGM